VAADAAGELFVSDPGAGRIQQFSGAGVLIDGWGLPPDQDAFEPQGLGIRADGLIVVAELRRAQVLLFEPTE
jgi:hypothetical protein